MGRIYGCFDRGTGPEGYWLFGLLTEGVPLSCLLVPPTNNGFHLGEEWTPRGLLPFYLRIGPMNVFMGVFVPECKSEGELQVALGDLEIPSEKALFLDHKTTMKLLEQEEALSPCCGLPAWEEVQAVLEEARRTLQRDKELVERLAA